MRKLIAIFAVMTVCGCLLIGCNEKPKSYHFVKVMPDGKELVEDITATNDTDALKQYLNTMEQLILENMDKPEAEQQQFKAMYVISPDGDTLNTNNELLEAVMKGEAGVTTVHHAPAQAAPKMTPLKREAMPQGQPVAPAK